VEKSQQKGRGMERERYEQRGRDHSEKLYPTLRKISVEGPGSGACRPR